MVLNLTSILQEFICNQKAAYVNKSVIFNHKHDKAEQSKDKTGCSASENCSTSTAIRLK